MIFCTKSWLSFFQNKLIWAHCAVAWIYHEINILKDSEPGRETSLKAHYAGILTSDKKCLLAKFLGVCKMRFLDSELLERNKWNLSSEAKFTERLWTGRMRHQSSFLSGDFIWAKDDYLYASVMLGAGMQEYSPLLDWSYYAWKVVLAKPKPC